MDRPRATLALVLGVAAAALFLSASLRCRAVEDPRVRRLCAKTSVFLGGLGLWSALFVLLLGGFSASRPFAGVAFLLVLVYLGLELKSPREYTGGLGAAEGSVDLFFERGTQVTTAAFALGTLLMSQRDPELARLVAPLVFLALFFAVLPSLAVGQTARRHAAGAPFLSAAQRLALSFAAGLLCLSLAVCLDHVCLA